MTVNEFTLSITYSVWLIHGEEDVRYKARNLDDAIREYNLL